MIDNDKIFNLLALLQNELTYNITLMSGLYPKTYVDEHIVPMLNTFNTTYNEIMGWNSYDDVGLTS